MRILFVLSALLVLGGCANSSLYNWGDYESALYTGYKDPTKMEAMKLALEAHVAEIEKTGQKMAPGLYAELGTLYLQAGATDQAIAMYTREQNTWPESRGLMSAMIQNLERRQHAKAEVAK